MHTGKPSRGGTLQWSVLGEATSQLSALAPASHPHWICSTDLAEQHQRCFSVVGAGNTGGADHSEQETAQKALQPYSSQHPALQHGVKPGHAALAPQEGFQLYPDTLRSDAAFRSAHTHRRLRTESWSATCFGVRRFHLPVWLQLRLVKFYLLNWDKAEAHTAPGNPPTLGPVIIQRSILALERTEPPKGLQIAWIADLQDAIGLTPPIQAPGKSYSMLIAVCKGLSFYLWVTVIYESTA